MKTALFTWRRLCCCLLLCMSLQTTLWGQTQKQLVESVKAVYETKDSAKFSELWYSVGGLPEEQKFYAGFIEKNKTTKWEVEVQIKEFSEYRPTGEFPLPLNGRKRIFVINPTHWILVRCKDVSEGTGFKFTSNFNLFCALVDGKWQLIGSKFADKSSEK